VRRVAIALLLACATPPRARPLATGPASPFAYEHSLRAEFESAHGRPWAAVVEWRRAVASDPDSVWLRLRLTHELEHLGRLEEATVEAAAAAAIDPADPEPHVALAEITWRQGDLRAAEAALEDALARDPEHERAYERLSDLLALRGATGDARDALLARWIAARPGSAEAWCRTGRSAIERGEHGEAISAYAHCVERAPARVADRLRLADLHDAAGNEAAAVQTLRAGLDTGRDRFALLERLLPLLVRGGKDREVGALLDTIEPAGARDDGDALVGIGYLYLSARRSQRAEALGREALAREPASPRAALLVADALVARGERDAALAELARVGPGAPRYVDAQVRAISLLRDAGRLDEALAMARALGREQPSLAAPFELAATCLLREGDLAAALGEVREALRREPDRPTALGLLGVLQAERGENLDEALATARRALALRPGSGQILHDVGWIQFRAGRIDEARRTLERAARVEPGSETIRRHLDQLRARASAPERRPR
jgi:tetratricopeptide (TPR) repeat protein